MFGWVDFSDEERRRASEVMNLVRYPGTIDELGFGVLRDAFADRLFPATSTLHTHARYYYLVAYLLKDIERTGAGRTVEELQAMLQDGEMRTARRLVAWSKKNEPRISGITGSDSLESGWVKMTPATMDWAAIQRLQIFRDPAMKLRGFLSSVSATPKGDVDALLPEGLSESSVDYANASLWNVPFEVYRTWDEGDELSMWLDRAEAEDLGQRIKRLFPDTLYARIADYALKADLNQITDGLLGGSKSFIRFVELGGAEQLGCGADLRELCDAAADLSAFVSLLHIRFNHVLRRKAEVEDFEENDACASWQECAYEASSAYHRRTASLDIDAAFRLCGVSTTLVRNLETYRFLKAAQRAYLAEELDELDGLIERREKHLKGVHRSKIANAKAYCGEWFGGVELTYRLEVALMVASEVNMALEADR